MCHNGDVLLVFSASKKMQLHSEILSRHCEYFRNSFEEYPSVDISSSARKIGVTLRWRFDLALYDQHLGHHSSRKAHVESNNSNIGELHFTVSFSREKYFY